MVGPVGPLFEDRLQIYMRNNKYIYFELIGRTGVTTVSRQITDILEK